jgi:hypothetical protein
VTDDREANILWAPVNAKEGTAVTQLLEKALSEVAKLDEPEQDALASILLEEIASEERWSRAFAESQEILASLADEALEEHAAGRTRPL